MKWLELIVRMMLPLSIAFAGWMYYEATTMEYRGCVEAFDSVNKNPLAPKMICSHRLQGTP